MEQQREDQLIQELLINLDWANIIISEEYRLQKGISGREWDEIAYIMIERGYMEALPGPAGTFSITAKGRLYKNGRHFEDVSKERLLQQKTEEEEKINKEKVSLEIKQLKRNSILSWLSVAISLIALIFGIASYFKPTNSSIEKQYIPVDSHGKIYETLNKN